MLLFAAFTAHFHLQDFPAPASTLVAFGEFLLRSFRAPKSVFNALASLGHFHLDHELDTGPFNSRQVYLWRRAVETTVRHVPQGAPPLSREVLRAMCELAGRLGPLGWLFAALASVLYCTMARLSSLLPVTEHGFDSTRLPTWADLDKGDGHWSLQVKWAKAHQGAEQGFRVPLLAVPGAPECPVANLGRLWGALRNPKDNLALFTLPEEGAGVRTRVLTMQVARDWLRLLLRRVGCAERGFTFHSFRRGACSRAFRNGAEVADIQQLGGWRSEAVRLYLPLDEARRRAALALN